MSAQHTLVAVAVVLALKVAKEGAVVVAVMYAAACLLIVVVVATATVMGQRQQWRQ